VEKDDRLSGICRVLSVDKRVHIVQLLKGRALCVNALAARLGVTQGAVSQHLRIMRDAGLVIDEKRGYYVHYRLNERTLAKWREAIGGLLGTSRARHQDTKGAKRCVAMKRRAVRNRKT